MLGAAKLFFLLAAYVTTVSLTYLIEPAQMGRYNVVARLIAVPNMVLIQTLLFAVSRPLAAQYSEGFPSFRALRRRGRRVALGLGGLTFVVFFGGADLLASGLRDPSLATPIRVVAPISLIYALYAVNIGTLNAARRFGLQAGLDIFMAFTKMSLIVAAAALGFGLASTLGGFTAASAAAMGLSVLLVAKVKPSAEQSDASSPIVSHVVMLIAFTATVHLLTSTDLFLLKRYAVSEAQADAVGFYSSAQLVALVPYSLLAAVSLLIFPLIASLDSNRDAETVSKYVSRTVQVSVLVLVLMASVASGCAEAIQALLFPQAYGEAAQTLRVLVWGYSGYALTVTSAWVFNSAKKGGVSLALVALTFVTVAAFGLAWIPEQGSVGAARAAAVGGGVGAVASLVALWRAFAARLAPLPTIGLLSAGAATMGAGWWLHQATVFSGLGTKVGSLMALAVCTVVFGAVALVTGAVKLSELRELVSRGGS